jgi:hypothetical protein
MVNSTLLHETLNKIEWNEFHWDQGSWVSSECVHSGVPFKEFNECKTSFCFAGHVASRNRELLYARGWEGFYASEFFIPEADDDENRVKDNENAYTELYRPVKEDGVVTFERYFGKIITARTAAILDLGITNRYADVLFHSDNSLEYIRGVVDLLSNVDD